MHELPQDDCSYPAAHEGNICGTINRSDAVWDPNFGREDPPRLVNGKDETKSVVEGTLLSPSTPEDQVRAGQRHKQKGLQLDLASYNAQSLMDEDSTFAWSEKLPRAELLRQRMCGIYLVGIQEARMPKRTRRRPGWFVIFGRLWTQ